ncbi:MAG: hypothetical protein O3C25_03860 [Chloroflexi bacterium]|nr:hypothetical protein [Chloroflexota bacterium]
MRASRLVGAEDGSVATSAARNSTGAWAESSRLRRLASHLAGHEELVDRSNPQVDEALEPLRLLLDRQASAIDSLTATLGAQLGPVRAFADSEESNLRMLQERMEGDDMGVVAQDFSDLVTLQRERIEATRARIERQREPFAQFLVDERKTIELALGRFDSDIDALESVLAEQRAVTLRLLDAMRSDEFREVQAFLLERQQTLDEIARGGITDPSELATRLELVRAKQPPDASRSVHLGQVLDSAAATDARLTTIGTPVAPEPAQPEGDAEADEASAAA